MKNQLWILNRFANPLVTTSDVNSQKTIYIFVVLVTIIPGEEACIMSGLKRAISEIILGLRASERGTFW